LRNTGSPEENFLSTKPVNLFDSADKNFAKVRKAFGMEDKNNPFIRENPFGFVNAIIFKYGSDGESLFDKSSIDFKTLATSYQNIYNELITNKTIIALNESFFKENSVGLLAKGMKDSPFLKFNQATETTYNKDGSVRGANSEILPLIRIESTQDTVLRLREDITKIISKIKKDIGIIDGSGGGGSNKQNVEGNLIATPMIANFDFFNEKFSRVMKVGILKILTMSYDLGMTDSRPNYDKIDFNFNSISKIKDNIAEENSEEPKPEDKDNATTE
jgi:hypothetical protein